MTPARLLGGRCRSALASAAAISVLFGTPLAAVQPTGLTSTPISNRLGLELNEFSLGWEAPGAARYQVLLASDEAKLAAEVGDLWDSGVRDVPAQARGVTALGAALPGGATVWWKVRTWSADGAGGEWSEPAPIVVDAPPRHRAISRLSAVRGEAKFVSGRHGEAVELGEEATVEVADYDALRSAAGVTIAAWVRPDEAGDRWQSIYRKEDGARRLLAFGKEGPFWGLWCGVVIDGNYVEFGAPVERAALVDGQWHHVAFSYDGEWMRLFFDGRVVGEQERRGSLAAGGEAPAFIGSFEGRSEWLSGALDDLRLYRRGLDQAEVANLASGQLDVAPDALAAHFAFDGDASNGVTSERQASSRNRIALLGGTTVYEMEADGHLEAAILARWPHHDITVRNLAWPGDDVFGTARSEFGSAQNTRSWRPPGSDPGFGASERARQVREAEPTTIIVGYGAEAAWADSEERMAEFEAGYRQLIGELAASGAKLILLTPIPHVRHPGARGSVAERNRRLGRASRFILELAERGGHDAYDLFGGALFGPLGVEPGDGPGYRSGFQLNAVGMRALGLHLAQLLEVGLGAVAIESVEGVAGGAAFAINGKHARATSTRRGFAWRATLDQLPVEGTGVLRSPWGEGARVALRVDGETVAAGATDAYQSIAGGPDFDQFEELRAATVTKNLLYRYRLRPINKAYIFLFRRHEMGHLAHEIDELEALVAERERAIALLRVPRPHSYQLDRLDEWKAPRDYPDHEVPREIPAPDVAAELAAFTVADGFEVNLFASDPWIANPINLNWDRHGRAWVSTSTTYPHIKPGSIPDDRIVILEDRDADGVADRHSVFADGLTVPHSVMPVEGGAYVCSATQFLFLEDRDGDGVSDARRVVFDGFGNADVHHMIHGLRWAPWGDLHFLQSIYINSFVDTAFGPRRMNGSGVWRLRPETERLEPFAVGMVNPWGFAFDEWGQSFATDGAGGAGPHYVFPGAAFASAVGAHRVLPGLIPGKPKNTAAEFASGRHLPDHWQGSLLANDFRANRTVRYELREDGSGFAAREAETVLHSSHRSFRPVDIKIGPDGAIYVVDWYNPIIDHGEVDFHHPLRDKSHGRIWRITAKGRPTVTPPAIAGAPVSELVMQLGAPEQAARTRANRELAARPEAEVAPALRKWVEALDPASPRFEQDRLEALWLGLARGEGDRDLLHETLESPDHRARAAAVRAASRWRASERHAIDQLAIFAAAVADEHPRVRLEAVNALRGLGTAGAAEVALRALDRPTDNNLDFALELTVRVLSDAWLGAMLAGEEVFGGDLARLAFALSQVNDARAIETLVGAITRGEIEQDDLPNAAKAVAALGRPEDVGAVAELACARYPDLLPAVAAGARAGGSPPASPDPGALAAHLAHGRPDVRAAAAELIGRWRVRDAAPALVGLAGAGGGDASAAAAALALLGDVGALAELARAGRATDVRAAAVSAWAGTEPDAAAREAVELFAAPELTAECAQQVTRGFLAHRDGAAALVNALDGHDVPSEVAIAALHAAQASGLEVNALAAALARAGGIEMVPQDMDAGARRALLDDALAGGDAARGREVFERESLACVACHRVGGAGGQLGPDLTTVGSYMTPESLLESLLNPSSSIKQGYETVVVTKRDGTLVSGLLERRAEGEVLVRNPAGDVVAIPDAAVANIDASPVSLMPPGLTAQLRRDELVDLMSYLISLGAAR